MSRGLVDLLGRLAAHGELVHHEQEHARPAIPGALARPLPDAIHDRLPPLWSHQAEAIDLLRSGRHTVIATGTASGKSLCFQAPIGEAIWRGGAGEGPPATSLVLYPTKALAQDQRRAFGDLDFPGLVAATYDGDTPPDERAWIRRNANVVLTNPDMLHAALLPNHGRWAPFLSRLRYVVVDELHVLRGIFGSHVAHVLRRLRRICARYGADPTFVFSSATIGSAGLLAQALLGDDVVEVAGDGAPTGERVIAVWQPALVEQASGARVPATHETARLLAAFVNAGHRTVAFARSRRSVEVIALHARRMLPASLTDAVQPYRAGYLPAERRRIEAELFSGTLRGVAATSALELGVDIGGLDAAILCGFPGTLASFRQQIGRAGRRTAPSVAVLVTGSDALDQWYGSHPRELVVRPSEPAVINPSNPEIADAQLACAAYEEALTPGDERYWGDDLDEGVRRLVHADVLRLREGAAVYAGRGRPATAVGLRSGASGEVEIVDEDGVLIGTIDASRAPSAVHQGAVYLHQGRHFRVDHLDLEEGVAWVSDVEGEETTQARSSTSFRICETEAVTTIGRAGLALGTVEVTDQVTGYRRRSLVTGEALGDVDLDLPPTTLVTRGFWYTFEPAVLGEAGVDGRALAGTLHAAEHAGIGILPLFAICDRWDVGGVSTPHHADTEAATFVIYDGYPGGVGVAELGFASGTRHLAATWSVIDECPCEGGCPSCVQSPKCGNLNDPLDKDGAARLLAAVLGYAST